MMKKFQENLPAGNVKNHGGSVEQEEKLRVEVETVRFQYLGDRESAGGGCEAVVTARTRCWWANLMECR